MEIEYSEYQQDIFDFVKYGYGNAIISAVAGSGKTFTILKALDYIKQNKKILFLAFNVDIVKEIKSKIKRSDADVKTLHSLGYSILKCNFKNLDIKIDEYKYKNRLEELIRCDEISIELENIKSIIRLCDLARFFMVKTNSELSKIAFKYGILSSYDELDLVIKLINWGIENFTNEGVIDFTDMIYLPNIIPNLRIFKYDFIIIDEAQDLSIAQMGLFLKCAKLGSRFIAAGDEKQCINGFAGSDIDSFDKIRKINSTIELPLSICYRCPKNIVKLAQKIVPKIEFCENSIDGEIDYKAKIEDIKDGDMIICRNTMPLVKLCFKLTDKNIPCYVKGPEIGDDLIALINKILSQTKCESINESIEYYISNILKADNYFINKDFSLDQEYNDIIDKLNCIKLISEKCNGKDELISKIKEMFCDKKNGICLSTIHKSKGLECDNVYILNNFLTPSKFAKEKWEIGQEINLQYVSYTRSKKKLGFIYDS